MDLQEIRQEVDSWDKARLSDALRDLLTLYFEKFELGKNDVMYLKLSNGDAFKAYGWFLVKGKEEASDVS